MHFGCLLHALLWHHSSLLTHALPLSLSLWCLQASTIICAASFLINIAYVWLIHKVRRHSIQQETLEKLKRKHTFKPQLLMALPALYWLVALEAFLLESGKAIFLHINR